MTGVRCSSAPCSPRRLSRPAVADGVGADLIEAAGVTFPAIVAGEGPSVIFVHGMFADDRVWAGLADATDPPPGTASSPTPNAASAP